MSTFDISFDRIFTNEGGFQKNYNDRGNWTTGIVGKGKLKGTKYGISAMTYPHLDIENLTKGEAKAIYKRDWWDKLNMIKFPKYLRYQMLDMAIHSGMNNAEINLQKTLGVLPDGIIGPKTLKALSEADINDVLMLFLSHRLEFLTNTRAWERNSKGFARRIAHNLVIAAKDNDVN